MGRIFNLIFQLAGALLVVFLVTCALVIIDGDTDLGERVDVALVLAPSDASPGQATNPLLDRVVKLYNDADFQTIILSGAATDLVETPAGMANYLEGHGIPSSAIILDRRGQTDPTTARVTAEIMKAHQFKSVMVIADYYRITRMKLALKHEGISDVAKAHVGTFHKEDAFRVGREVVSLYDYVARSYVLPAAENVKNEAQVGMAKATTDADKAKDKMQHSLDTLSK